MEDHKILEAFHFELLWKPVKPLLLIKIQVLFFLKKHLVCFTWAACILTYLLDYAADSGVAFDVSSTARSTIY